MPGPWITTDALLTEIAARIKAYPAAAPWTSELQNYWTPIATAANLQATATLTTILVGKGYSIGQIDESDQIVPWNTTQALFWALTNGGGLADYDDKFVEKLDLREWLKDEALLTQDGVPLLPALPGSMGFGAAVTGGQMTAPGDVRGATAATLAGGWGAVSDLGDGVKGRWVGYRRGIGGDCGYR